MLDTNTVSAAIRGIESVDRRLLTVHVHDWCLSSVTRSELQFGVARMPGSTRLAARVSAFLELANTLPWDSRAADHHGALRAKLRQTGNFIGDFDEMIAAHALAVGATLVTDNLRHFSRVEGLRLENWIGRQAPAS
ncbi:type II toxin-antitoxin system VapC family toxin [bacterium]|nr:type II toxin-antitoxin system VapC family toxin [bacterium]